MSNNGDDDAPDEKTATVIPWRGRATPTGEAPRPEAPSPDTLELADPATVDAFEAAVRRAIAERLTPGADPGSAPDVPTFPPRGPDDLLAQVYSALSGKDPSVALSEVRDQLAGRVRAHEESAGADIIDLAAAREARKVAAGDASHKLGGALKDTFNQFIAEISALNAHRNEVVLDARFFKEHGPSLLGSLFQGLATALLKTSKPAEPAPVGEAAPVEVAPTEGAEPTSEAPSEATAAPKEPVQVNVKVDFASLVAGLFRRRQPEPTPPTPTTTPEDPN